MDFLKVGVVLKPQGIKGDLKIEPLTDDPQRFNKLKKVYLKNGGDYTERGCKCVRIHEGYAYLHLHGVEDCDTAQTLRGQLLYVDRENAVELPDGSYFICDLINCEVVDEEGRSYGRVTDVLQTGANDVYVVKGEKELLMPALKKLIASVDVAGKRIHIRRNVVSEVVADAD